MTGSSSPLRQSESHDIPVDDASATKAGADEDDTPDSVRRLFVTPSTGTFSGTTRNEDALNDLERGHSPSLYSTKGYLSWLHSPSQKSLLAKDQRPSQYGSDEYASLQGHLCNSSKQFKQSMLQWPANGILLLSLISTALSGMFFLVAVIGPRYGGNVGTHGILTASTAAFLTSFLAKIIEVSFVTLVVAYIGQSLARKAFAGESPDGVSFAEISMRHWAVQPG